MQGPVLGIDLGLSSCRVAVMTSREPVLVGSRTERALPSCVALAPDGKVVVGAQAQRLMGAAPTDAVAGPKVLLGTRFEAPGMAAWRAHQSARVVKWEGDQPGVVLGDRTFTGEELVAMLLFAARDWAQTQLGRPVYRIVVTAAPSRDASVTLSMRKAAVLAGLRLLRTVSEPVAAVLAATMKSQDPASRLFGVLDWGASSLRFSLVRGTPKELQIVGTAAEPGVGGRELSRLLEERLLLGFLRQAGLESKEALPPVARQRLRDAVDLAKVLLSSRPETLVNLPQLVERQGRAVDFSARVRAADLESLFSLHLERAFLLFDEVLGAKGLSARDLDSLVVVGEQSHLPALRRRLPDFFQGVELSDVDPATAGAFGAAIAGHLAARRS